MTEISQNVSRWDYAQHCHWMKQAIAQANIAGNTADVPVGAVLIGPQGNCLAVAGNRRERRQDPTAHAEIIALRLAARHLGRWRLHDCTLYVTLEPCPMCAGAIIQSRLRRVIYGADDLKTGALRSVLNLPDSAASFHRVEVLGGILEAECRQQLQDWFAKQRSASRVNPGNPRKNAAPRISKTRPGSPSRQG